jgi:anionic cell wall polymer biosynthesis LytR-Cps2A-Psr (LCP) family protein
MTPADDLASRHLGKAMRRTIAVMASISLAIGAVSTLVAVGYVMENSRHTQKFPPSSSGASPDQAIGACTNQACNYLILGSDSRSNLTKDEQANFGNNTDIGGSARSDVIMLVHTQVGQKTTILSFPRDLWVNIPGKGENKINASFEGGIYNGGPVSVAKTIHDLTGLKISHFLYVDLAGFQNVVDTVGGVDMCIPPYDVNTPGWLTQDSASGSTQVYVSEVGHVVDLNTGLDLKPGCQHLNGVQALSYVRSRSLPCDAIPDFGRIGRQQAFLRTVLNKLLQPSEILRLPAMVDPVLSNLRRDSELSIADLVYLTGQLQGVSTGDVIFRDVPATPTTAQPSWSPIPLDVLKVDPSAQQLFAALREGRPLPAQTGVAFGGGVSISEANIELPVVDHSSGGKAAGVETIASQAGFIIASGIIPYATFGSGVKGSVIAYAPGHQDEASVVSKYFGSLPLKRVSASQIAGYHVAVFVTEAYSAETPDGPHSNAADCPTPARP